MRSYLRPDVLHRVLNSVDHVAFSHPELIHVDLLWAIVDECFINPMYRCYEDNDAYKVLFQTTYPSDVAGSKFNLLIALLETEPFFQNLQSFRYVRPASVYVRNGIFQVVWSE